MDMETVIISISFSGHKFGLVQFNKKYVLLAEPRHVYLSPTCLIYWSVQRQGPNILYIHYRTTLHSRLHEAILDDAHVTDERKCLFSSCNTIIILAKYIDVSLKHHVYVFFKYSYLMTCTKCHMLYVIVICTFTFLKHGLMNKTSDWYSVCCLITCTLSMSELLNKIVIISTIYYNCCYSYHL